MNSVIIVAGGSGSRMNMNINKQFIKINEKEAKSKINLEPMSRTLKKT